MPLSFTQQLKSFAAKAEARETKVVRRASVDALGRLSLRSPVDTGRFRGNWVAGVNVVGVSDDVPDKTGADTMQKGEEVIMTAVAKDTVYLTNNLPYAKSLEYGSSAQAPAGMVGITIAEWPGIVEDAVDAVK